LLKEYRYK